MPIENHRPWPEDQENVGIDNTESVVLIEPQPRISLAETRRELHEEFRRKLTHCTLRELVRYVEDAGIELKDKHGITRAWSIYFAGKPFRSQSYTWTNPKLFLLTKKIAGAHALDELLTRVEGHSPDRHPLHTPKTV